MLGGDAPGLAADMLWEGVQMLLLLDIPFNCVSVAGPPCAPGKQGRPALGNAAAWFRAGSRAAVEMAPAPCAAR